MIRVDNLTKSYGPARALKGVSFEVAKGEIVGFLGPNGAGKSTTMKILTGFLEPTSGTATVDGYDVVRHGLETRRRIGYLPESTPLYAEMRVDDYLRFAGEIRGVARGALKSKVARVVELCGLRRVVGKNILELSKGYRQRVGLAQAMIHEPDILVLDEPTSGLDPNQIVEVRALIERLGAEHTVILSTHYLQEVEASCSRIIIINLGEIVADDTAEGLLSEATGGTIVASIRGPVDKVQRQIGELFPGLRAEPGDAGPGGFVPWRITLPNSSRVGDRSVEDAVAQLVVRNDWNLAELRRERASLEDVFRDLTLEAQREALDA
jgi:ABC-2 type transport system ATP-binding protein